MFESWPNSALYLDILKRVHAAAMSGAQFKAILGCLLYKVVSFFCL